MKKTIKRNNYPRLTVFRSNNHIYAQVIDDVNATTIVSCSTLESQIRTNVSNTSNCIASKLVGETIAKRLLAKNIDKVSFDRRKKLYHGRIKALADAARENGLNF